MTIDSFCRQADPSSGLSKFALFRQATIRLTGRRSIPYILVVCLVLFGGCEQLGLSYRNAESGGADQAGATSDDGSGASGSNDSSSNSNPGTAPSANRLLMVGAFNIKDFGKTKSEKLDVIMKLQELVYSYDVLAIQEIESQELQVLKDFVIGLNREKGTNFNFITGPFSGATTAVEQYAFIYDAGRVEPVGDVFVVGDPKEQISREPLVARFRVRSELTGGQTPFSFVLATVHTDPKAPVKEINYLASIVSFVKEKYPDEDDVMILGDLNLDPEGIFTKTDFQKLTAWKPILGQAIKTNITEEKSYDNILYSPIATTEYQNRSGVIDVKKRFGIGVDQAKRISDHQPIWAAFSLTETEQQASAPSGVSAF